MWLSRRSASLYAFIVVSSFAEAIKLDVHNTGSIKQTASTIAFGLMSLYTGNQSSDPNAIGQFPSPLYWWESGAIWGGMVDYWHLTGDKTYNEVVTNALVSQVSPTLDFMPPAVNNQLGNDDQSFWAFAAMSAAEHGFPNPPSGSPSWLALASAVFDDQVHRWDTATCNGGLKWQIFPSNNGFDYKNSVASGAFFQLAARLARHTGNETYTQWATKSWDWLSGVGLISPQYHVYDGTDDTGNCTVINEISFSYTTGILLYGAAVLANYTNGSALWSDRTVGLLGATVPFFTPFPNASFIMYEPACETQGTCNSDQLSFKAYLARWMWASTQLFPSINDAVTTLLQASAQGAAQSCTGSGSSCGQKWYYGGYDGNTGVGQQLSALEVVQGLLVAEAEPPSVEAGVHIVQATSTTSVPIPSTTVAPPAGEPAPAPSPPSEGVLGATVGGTKVTLAVAVVVVVVLAC